MVIFLVYSFKTILILFLVGVEIIPLKFGIINNKSASLLFLIILVNCMDSKLVIIYNFLFMQIKVKE